MNKAPLVSIIIPAFNVEKYISKCLYSVLAQTYEKMEIIIINDESTDSTLKICNQFLKRDNRIKIYTQKNSGPSAARNNGLKKSSGKYFFFLDSDDTLDKNLIKHMVLFAEKENVQITFCGTTFKGGKTRIDSPEKDSIFSNLEVIRMCFRNENGILHSPWGKLFRNDLKKIIKFPLDMKYYEDEFLIYDVILKSTTGIISKDTYNYNIRENSLITSKDTIDEKTKDFKKAILHMQTLFAKSYPNIRFDYQYRFILDNIMLVKYNIPRKANNDTLFFAQQNIHSLSLKTFIESKLGINLFLESICIKYFPKIFKKIYKELK